jgi:uncharacterized phage infection (PIP) family protein YhgE
VAYSKEAERPMKFPARLRAILAFILNRPLRVQLLGGDAHLFPDGLRILPVIAGGAEEAEAEAAEETETETETEKPAEKTSKEEKTEEAETEAEAKPEKGEDWKAHSRKHEREAKKARKELEEERAKLKEREDADKSEQDKAIDKAREEGKTEALTVAEKDRRNDRLEVAVTRIASKPITLGEGDEAKPTKFADPEDAQVFLDRAISSGDLDADEVFGDDGKVKIDVVTIALKEILEERPRLAEAAADSKLTPKAKGSADGGKGSGIGDGNKELEDMSVEDHFKRIRRSKD